MSADGDFRSGITLAHFHTVGNIEEDIERFMMWVSAGAMFSAINFTLLVYNQLLMQKNSSVSLLLLTLAPPVQVLV